MKIQEVKFKNANQNYSILIGNNILSVLPKKLKHYVQEQIRLL